MADFTYPPIEPGTTPDPLSPTVPLNPPMVGELSPFDHVDGQNRDLILEGIRAWARGPLRTWSGAWQANLDEWLERVKQWLDGWAAAVDAYLDARDAELLELISGAFDEIQTDLDADIAGLQAQFVALRNEVINSTISITAPIINKVAVRTLARAPGVPIETFLTDSEYDAGVLTTNGAAAEDVYWQRAYNNVPRTAGKANRFYVGPGIHRLNQGVAATTARRDVSFCGPGSGMMNIVLGPEASAIIYGYGDSRLATPTYFENLAFEGFSFDGSEQVATPFESKKGFILGHVRDSLFHDIRGKNTWATMYGVDFQTRVYWDHVYGEGAGRGVNMENTTGFGSTFGFGVGATADESIIMTDVGSKNAKRMGLNAEWLLDYGLDLGYYDGFISIDGFDFNGDAIGVGALGIGLFLSNGRIRRSLAAGGVIGTGGQAPMGGRNVYIAPSVIIENTLDGFPTQKWLDVRGGHGLVLRGQGAGGARIEPTIVNVAGHGIYVEPGFTLEPSDRGIDLNPRIYNPGGQGISWRNGGRQEKGVRIGGFIGHAQDVAIDLRTSTIGAQITTTYNCDSKQTTAIRLDNTVPTTSLVARGVAYNAATLIAGNDVPANYVNPHTTDLYNVPTPGSDPSRSYFSSLVTPVETSGLGAGWTDAGVSTVFTSTVGWYTHRNGARPYIGEPGNAGRTARKISAGQVGYRITATIDPTETGYSRLGIMVCLDPTTGACLMLENYSGSSGEQSYQLKSYDAAGVSTPRGTYGAFKGNEIHEIGIYVSATGNAFKTYVDGVEMASANFSTVTKTSIVGVCANAQGAGEIRNFKIELMA